MDQLKLQVAKARRRLVAQQFLAVLVWCWFATLLAGAAAIAAQKRWLVDVDGTMWAAAWLGGAVVVGMLAAVVWTWLVRLPELEAALEIDRRFGLKERVSSTLALSADELQSPFGQALAEDAQRRISRLDVDSRFPVSLHSRAWLPALPATIAFALCFLADPTRPTQGDANATPVALSKQIKESLQPLPNRLDRLRERPGEQPLSQEADEHLKKLAERVRDLAKKDETDRSDALAKLNDLTKETEKRRDRAADTEKLKQQFAAMKNLPSGPADKLAQDLKNGKFDKALQELQKLKEQMALGKLDPKQQQELAEQMNAMKDALQKMVDAHKKAQEDLQKQIEQAQKNGDQQAAKDLQEQLNRLQQQQPQMDRLQNLANQLGQCGECMKNGNVGEAQAALNEMANQLAQMQQELAEMEMMQAALDEIADAKAAMGCGQCQGAGCAACQGNGQPGFSNFARNRGDAGSGPREENPHDTKHYDTKVRQNVGKGSAVITGLIEGPNAKGQAMEEIKGQVEAARAESADPLTGQRLPRQQRDHVQQYFDAFRKGQ